MKLYCFVNVPSAFGEFTIVWRDSIDGARVHRVLLPGDPGRQAEVRSSNQALMSPLSHPAIEALVDGMRRFLEGQPVGFPTSLIDLGQCTGFQRRVLLAEHRIPRGRVSTYGRIAAALGWPAAARAVGTALARNPFPIIIPCHRTVRSDGDPGGFGGGPHMKRALLELEGVEFTSTGKVAAGFFC